jgi:predicted GIY-YIG superfamily endonuclease
MKVSLYRHYAADGTLLYVGMANSALRRLDGHRAKSSWLNDIVRVEIEWFETRADAHAAERAAVNTESPKHNRIRYVPKPPKAERVLGDKHDPNNAARVARHRKARALGYEHVAGYLPPKRAAKVRQWLVEAKIEATDWTEIAAAVQARPRDEA